jgi:D-glycero-alpha-D-manno-heptose-7-phosphate kinase
MIKSSAPTRIDLAGGTLDIWPLYLLLGCPPTLNAAINLYATVEIRPRKDRRIVVESKDLGLKAEFSSLAAVPDRHPLELILRTIKFYLNKGGLSITTHCQAPQGSGIGGSSALNIALHGALNQFVKRRYPRSSLIEYAKNIETQVLRVPAGHQDYYPALHGGVLSLQPGVSGIGVKKIKLDLQELTSRFVLCYTGKPRSSGINNWQVMKKTLDGDRKVIQHLSRIGAVAKDTEKALAKGQLEPLAELLAKEWRVRKALAPGISTPEIDRLIIAAKRKGALSAKVCGAGGGGCVAFFVKKGMKQQVADELTRLNGQVLDFAFVQRGLRVQSL